MIRVFFMVIMCRIIYYFIFFGPVSIKKSYFGWKFIWCFHFCSRFPFSFLSFSHDHMQYILSIKPDWSEWVFFFHGAINNFVIYIILRIKIFFSSIQFNFYGNWFFDGRKTLMEWINIFMTELIMKDKWGFYLFICVDIMWFWFDCIMCGNYFEYSIKLKSKVYKWFVNSSLELFQQHVKYWIMLN